MKNLVYLTVVLTFFACSDAESLDGQTTVEPQDDGIILGQDTTELDVGLPFGDTVQEVVGTTDVGGNSDTGVDILWDVSTGADTGSGETISTDSTSTEDVTAVADGFPLDAVESDDVTAEPDTDVVTLDAPGFVDWEKAVSTNDTATLADYLANYDMPVCEAGFCLIFTKQSQGVAVEILGEFNAWADGTTLQPIADLSGWYFGKIAVNFTQFTEYQLKVNGEWTRDESNRYIRFGPFGFNSAIYGPNHSRITALWQVSSSELGNKRDVYIYLPAAYFNDTSTTFPVLYLQDGFNVFENPLAPFGSWNVDITADATFAENSALPAIFVAIDTKDRLNEYLYTDAALPGGTKATPKLDLYASFVVNTLKPLVDSTFRTKPDRKNTAIGGSSLGGISSAYIAWVHSAVFGAAASFSGSFWIGENGEAGPPFREIVTNNEAGVIPGSVRYYLDSGDTPFGQKAAYTGDSWVYTDWTRNALISKGWENRPEWDTDSDLNSPPANLSPSTPPEDVPALVWSTTPPPPYNGWADYLGWDSNLVCLVGQGHSHNEAAWEQRFGAALRFLFPPSP